MPRSQVWIKSCWIVAGDQTGEADRYSCNARGASPRVAVAIKNAQHATHVLALSAAANRFAASSLRSVLRLLLKTLDPPSPPPEAEVCGQRGGVNSVRAAIGASSPSSKPRPLQWNAPVPGLKWYNPAPGHSTAALAWLDALCGTGELGLWLKLREICVSAMRAFALVAFGMALAGAACPCPGYCSGKAHQAGSLSRRPPAPLTARRFRVPSTSLATPTATAIPLRSHNEKVRVMSNR
jgi:hypothetical protein